ncbi:LOW QUALITY PROTEIN: cadherin-2-like, partial [Lethenteron reissneri]|uniref:LOW QUALITY PROTEIN: cadherin-2-like n=1 Tax=Lethenteron reissneri TaxID=7753 RepID=UPI002AB71721
TFVMRVEASDLDDPLTPHGALRYDIHSLFHIDRRTGIITTRTVVGLDRERVARFSLVVMASDMEGDARISLSTTATAIITITDINDHAPEFTSRTWTGTVRENAVGVPVTMALLSVIDADEVGTAAWRVRYSLRGGGAGGAAWGAGDPQDLFAVETDPATNDGRIVVVKPLDFEMASSYKLIVVVDNEEPSVKSAWTPPQSTATVHGDVEDENEAPLFEPRLQQVRLSEGVALGSVVTTLVARDPDSAQKQSLRYGKLRVPGDWLEVDAVSGVVSTAAEIDRESPLVRDSVYTATFLATDNGSPASASGTSTLRLLLSDVNDNAPTAAVWPPGAAACPHGGVTVMAADEDQDPNGRPFRFQLAPGVGGDKWKVRQVDANSSQLLARSPLPEGLHWVELVVWDSGTPPLGAVRRLQVPVCAACDHRGLCRRGDGAGASAVAVATIVVLVILLGLLGSLLLAVAFKRRRHGDKAGRWSLAELHGDLT